jgi:hypothetical protein
MAPRKKKGEFMMDIFMKFEDITLEEANSLNEFIKDGFSRESSVGMKPTLVNIDISSHLDEGRKNE